MLRVDYFKEAALPWWCKLRCHNYDNTICACLVNDDECVCACLYEILEKEVQIHILETNKHHRRKGYAFQLLDTILKAHTNKPVYLECPVSSKAQTLYTKMGFKLFAGYYNQNSYSVPVLVKPIEGVSILSMALAALETEEKAMLGREREKYLTNVAVWNPITKKFVY